MTKCAAQSGQSLLTQRQICFAPGPGACSWPFATHGGRRSGLLKVAEPTAGPHPPPLKHEWSEVVVTERLLSILMKLSMVMGAGAGAADLGGM